MKKILIISGLLISQFQGLTQTLLWYNDVSITKDTSDGSGFFTFYMNQQFACSYKDHISGITHEIPLGTELWCFPNYWTWFDTLYIHKINVSNGKTDAYQVYYVDSIQGKYYVNYNGEKLIFQENQGLVAGELNIFKLDNSNKEKLAYTYYFYCEYEFKYELLSKKEFMWNDYGFNMYRVHHYTDNKTNKLYQCKKLEKVVYEPSMTPELIRAYGKDTTYIFIVDFHSGDSEVFKQIKWSYNTSIIIDKNGVKKALDFSEKRKEFGNKHCNITGRHFGILDLTSGRVPIFNSGKTYHFASHGYTITPLYSFKSNK